MDVIVTRWWWIRHAPVLDHDGSIYGQTNPPADCSDAPVFAGLAALLPTAPVWVASHLQRAQQTARAILAATAGAAVHTEGLVIEPDLAEQNFGEWQGLTFDEIAAKRGVEHHRFWVAPAQEAPPGGESFVDVVTRVDRAVRRLTAAHSGRDIAAVAHGGTIRAALAVALGLDAERALSFDIGNCSLTRIDHILEPPKPGRGNTAVDRESWRLLGVNLPPGWPRRP
jgi:alpha-ribazole phosphatase